MVRKQVPKLDTIIAIILRCDYKRSESWYDIADFGKHTKEWLDQFIDLSGGIPSHDTFNEFFAMADSAAWRNVSVNGFLPLPVH